MPDETRDTNFRVIKMAVEVILVLPAVKLMSPTERRSS
jgi:hypothetical protein